MRQRDDDQCSRHDNLLNLFAHRSAFERETTLLNLNDATKEGKDLRSRRTNREP